MKTLTSTLEAAQRASSGRPYVQALLADYDGYARRARLSRVYTGAEQEDATAAAMAPDGSLLRLRRYTQAALLELQVGASADDGYETVAGVNRITDQEPLADSSSEYVGVRFQGVTIPQGATILRAGLSFVFSDQVNGDPEGTIYGDDSDNAAAFTTGTNNISNRTPTTATVSIDETGLLSDYATFVELAEVTAIVQEIVDRGGWSSGNALALIYHAGSDGSRDFQALHYDYGAALAPKLSILYATGTPQAEAFVSRVAAPDAGSTFSSWSSLDDEISALGGIALAVDSDTCYAFMVDDDLTTIVMRTSTDHGATWSSRSTVTAAGGAKEALAAAAADDDDIVLFYAELDGSVYAVRWNGSSWGSPALWTNELLRVTGLAACYLVDWQVIVTGIASTTAERGVWACYYGDGGSWTADTWGALRTIVDAAQASGVAFLAPSVWFGSVFRLFYAESYGGDVAYTRLQWSTLELSHDFNEEQWLEPRRADYAGAYGAAVTGAGSVMWLASSDGVWLTSLPAFAELDVSADVVEARVRADQEGAVVELELDNSAGAYTAYGAGDLGALQRGARLQLTPGYYTSEAAPETAAPYSYWVEAVELVSGSRPRLRLRARDAWSLLGAWRARRQLAWAAGEKTVSQLLLFLVARAGLEISSSGTSDAFTTLQPAFTVHPGETGLTAVRRLLTFVEDVAWWDGAELQVAATADDDSSTYDVGDGHAILGAIYRDLGPSANRVRVVGLEVYGEAEDFGEAERGERMLTSIDVNLTDGGDAEDRAAALLRQLQLEAVDDELELFGVHCGVEIYDVVDVTDDQVGLDGETRRVLGYAWIFDPRRARYEMTLQLGRV